MNRRLLTKTRKREINILETTTRNRVARKKLTRALAWTGGALIGLALVTVLVLMISRELLKQVIYENPRYTLKDIQIEQQGNLPSRPIEMATGVSVGQNLMTFDLRQIQKNVERLPYISEAQVQRQLPNRLIIQIRERIPVAKMATFRSDFGRFEWIYVDRDGIGMKPRLGEPVKQLPVIMGFRMNDFEPGDRIDAVEVLAAINLLKSLELTPLRVSVDINQIDVSQPLVLKVLTVQGARITFRQDFLPEQLQRLTEIYDYAQSNQHTIASVDLTPDRNVPVRYADVITANSGVTP